MSDRERRIRADWGQIQAAGRDLEKVAELLDLTREDLETQLEPLKLAVENGCLEYKTRLINGIFRELENERYRSLPTTTLDTISRDLAVLVYVATIQRLMADGHLPLRDLQSRQPDEDPVSETAEKNDVKEIIAEIQQRVRDEPTIRTRQPVKNILMQLSRYTKELEDFREVTARVSRDKAAAIGANFRKTTEEIYASIRKNYKQLLADDQAALPKEPQKILLRIDLKSMSPVYARQAKEAAGVRSTLHFARNEQFGTRELLIGIAGRHADFTAFVESERKRYEELGGTANLATEISRAFSAEISKRIRREIEYF